MTLGAKNESLCITNAEFHTRTKEVFSKYLAKRFASFIQIAQILQYIMLFRTLLHFAQILLRSCSEADQRLIEATVKNGTA
jgi:hypothetical protein